MSTFKLTRIVTMSSFFSLVNKSSYELEVGEVSEHLSTRWHYVSSAEVTPGRPSWALPAGMWPLSCGLVLQCLPFWPENPSGRLCLRVVGSECTSSYFLFNQQDNGTLLSLDLVRFRWQLPWPSALPAHCIFGCFPLFSSGA